MANDPATKEQQPKPQKSKFAVLNRLKHSGKVYPRKSSVSLTESEAQPLLALKTIEPAK